MFDDLEAALQAAEKAMAGLDPRSLVGTQPSMGVDVLVRHERVTAAARLAMVARAEEMHPWPREGYRCFEDWLAAKEGTSHGQARRKARTARQLRDRDRTADALADGEISEDEADVIADAADKNPAAERDLLDAARSRAKSHDDLKKKAAQAKAAGEDDQARADRLRRGRRAGWGTDREGFWILHGRFEPHVGAEIKARLAAEVDRIFNANRRAGTREPHDRYRADAIANLIRGHGGTCTRSADPDGAAAPAGAPHTASESTPDVTDGPGDQLDLPLQNQPGRDDQPTTTHPDSPTGPGPMRRAARELIFDINLQTWRRGSVCSGETSHIRGIGPVPIEIARQWADDAFIKAVIRDGTDVKKVVHYGRHVPAEVRTALGLIDQHSCQVPRCSNPRIEYDHDRPYADGGACSTTNLRALCGPHHKQRTHHGYELRGPPGDRQWLDPNGRILFADNPERLDQLEECAEPGVDGDECESASC